MDRETHYKVVTYWRGYPELYSQNANEDRPGGEAQILWRPFRESVFSPFVGIGGRYERIKVNCYHENAASPCSRVGAVLTLPGFERLNLKGEFNAGTDSNEIIGGIGLRLWRHFGLNAFVENFELKNSKDGNRDIDGGRSTACGGGITILF